MRTGIEEFLKTLKSITFHKLINSSLALCLKVVEKARGPNSIRNKLFKVFSPLIYPVNTSSFSAQFLWPTEESAGGHGHMGVPKLPTTVDATKWPREPKVWFLIESFAWSVLNLLVGTEQFWSWWYRVSIKRQGRNWLSAQKILGITCLFEKFWCLMLGHGLSGDIQEKVNCWVMVCGTVGIW